MKRKLLKRIADLAVAVLAWLPLPSKQRRRVDVVARRDSFLGQWHRWHKVNRRRQRQMSALKRLGVKIDPRTTGLPRWAVR